ncbi:MAG: UDP-N-acetylmuramoyl-L-alanine--D-glutamate ligase, partial [Pygmaiobacter sp.]
LEGLKGQDMILRTPGFEYFTPQLQAAKAAGAEITSEMELFFELCPCKKYGITGSDGKTTSSSLIAEMHRAMGKTVWLGGNIGRALLPLIDKICPEDVAVVELSSFQLISMHSSPDVAVITNITPNHLDHHKDMQEYIDAKRNILLYQSKSSKTVLGYHNEITRSLAKDVQGECFWFSRFEKVDKGAYLEQNGDLCYLENGVLTRVLHKDEVKLRGMHNVENLLDAIAATAGDVSFEKMALVGRIFSGVEHRIEPVRTLDGVQWYNDSIGTSPTRTIAGLRSFDQKLILIAGGYDKHIPYEPLAPEIVAHVKTLVLMGATGPVIERCVRTCESFDETAIEILHAGEMKDAVDTARAHAAAGDIVILSPASASFDKYPNFEKRGEEFKAIVNAL